MKVDRDDLVPLRPCSSTTFRTSSISLAMLSANRRDEWFSVILRQLILSAQLKIWLTENFTGINSVSSFDLENLGL